MEKSFKYIILMLIAYTVVVVPTGLIGGCSSGKLPSKLTLQERMVVNQGHMDITIGVEIDQYPAYSDSLLTGLKNTKLFREVKMLDEFKQKPDLIASVENRICGTAVIPLFTGLTLGLFPTWAVEEWGNSFSLRKSDESEENVFIELRYSGNTFLGWLSGMLNLLLPDRTGDCVRNHQQFIDAFKFKIASNKNNIISLLD